MTEKQRSRLMKQWRNRIGNRSWLPDALKEMYRAHFVNTPPIHPKNDIWNWMLI